MEDKIIVEVWGEQVPIHQDNRGQKTAGLMDADSLSKSLLSAANSNTKARHPSR